MANRLIRVLFSILSLLSFVSHLTICSLNEFCEELHSRLLWSGLGARPKICPSSGRQRIEKEKWQTSHKKPATVAVELWNYVAKIVEIPYDHIGNH